MKGPKLSLLPLALLAAVSTLGEASTDMIVATTEGLMLVNRIHSQQILRFDGDLENDEELKFDAYGTIPLAADPSNKRVYYSLPLMYGDRKISKIMYANLPQGNIRGQLRGTKLKHGRLEGHIRGLAYDQKNGNLYWTKMKDHSIWKCTIETKCEDASELIKLAADEEPASIAVDICGRHLFYANNNFNSSSVVRVSIEGKLKKKVLYNGNDFSPYGIAVDTVDGKTIYWTEDAVGSIYRIRSYHVKTKTITTLHREFNGRPLDMTYMAPHGGKTKGDLYWTDWENYALWTLDLVDPSKGEVRVNSWKDTLAIPMGVVESYPRSFDSDEICR